MISDGTRAVRVLSAQNCCHLSNTDNITQTLFESNEVRLVLFVDDGRDEEGTDDDVSLTRLAFPLLSQDRSRRRRFRVRKESTLSITSSDDVVFNDRSRNLARLEHRCTSPENSASLR